VNILTVLQSVRAARWYDWLTSALFAAAAFAMSYWQLHAGLDGSIQAAIGAFVAHQAGLHTSQPLRRAPPPISPAPRPRSNRDALSGQI
jgi:hypothetical protein